MRIPSAVVRSIRGRLSRVVGRATFRSMFGVQARERRHCPRCGARLRVADQLARSSRSREGIPLEGVEAAGRSRWCSRCSRKWCVVTHPLAFQQCGQCGHLFGLIDNYCDQCGLPAAHASDLSKRVAAILDLMAVPPHRRRRPRAGDLEGNYTDWFDGGAVWEVTGPTRVYRFDDGSEATHHFMLNRSVTIILPDGAEVTVKYGRHHDAPEALEG